MRLRTWKVIFSSTLVFIFTITLFLSADPLKAEGKGEISAMQTYVESMQPGWNLGNTFDATGGETSWGNPTTTKEMIEEIAATGYKSIRIPITWKHRMSAEYTIDPAFLTRIQEVVDWSLDADLFVMINLHHDTSWIMKMETEHDEVMDRFNAAWVQISAYFKDYPNKLMFESINEPRFSEDWNEDKPIYFEMLDELNTSFHRIVRKSGGNNDKRPLVLPTLTGSPSQARMDELAKTMAKLKDNNLIATIHYYGYYPFSVNVAGGTQFDAAAQSDLEQTFDRAFHMFVEKGVPVIVGEYGLLGFDTSLETIQHGEILKFFEHIGYYAGERKLTTMLWDNGQHFDRRALKWRDEELLQVMKFSFDKVRTSTTELDSIYVKKSADIADSEIRLNLNGNTLTHLKNNDKSLVKGTDYELDGDKLILKAELLKSLVNDGFGEQAVFTCQFSGGADWKLHIIAYDTPRLKSFEGSSFSYAIPTQFNGDRLATMEAVYAAGGGNAGPDGWTPFKAYNYSFKPVYDVGVINVTKEFFKDLREEEVLLKMHFWSGEVVEYTVTKNGSSVIGVSSNEPEEPAVIFEGEPSDSNLQGDTIIVNGSDAVVELGPLVDEDSDMSLYWVTGISVLILLAAGMGYYMVRKRRKGAQ